jgi:macrolide transport system ATP-binding/permease protein
MHQEIIDTVIIATHDMSVARHAHCPIEMRDGEVIADSGAAAIAPTVKPLAEKPSGGPGAFVDRLAEGFHTALLGINAHRLRTFLTMLGIIIGIASVVSVVALGEGSRQKTLANISSSAPTPSRYSPARDSATPAPRAFAR